MSALQLDGPQRVLPALLPTREEQLSAEAALTETLEYLVVLRERLWLAACEVQGSPPGTALAAPGQAARRVRRARQAAAIQGALHVLLELAREHDFAVSPRP